MRAASGRMRRQRRERPVHIIPGDTVDYGRIGRSAVSDREGYGRSTEAEETDLERSRIRHPAAFHVEKRRK